MGRFHKYVYEGPVMEFDLCIARRWKGETYAVSEQKAKSNLIYQFKTDHHKTADSKITLSGKVKVDRKDEYDDE